MKYLLIGFVIAIGLFNSSCYYDNAEDLYPELSECLTDSMSYAQDILPILNFHCMGCHSAAANQGGVTMEGYAAVKNYVDNESFLKSIQHQSGVSPMPKNQDQLEECTIKKVAAWIEQGALDN